MTVNRLRQLEEFGQSVWLDGLSREQLSAGELGQWIEKDGVSGALCNTESVRRVLSRTPDAYRAEIRRAYESGAGADRVAEQLVLQDARDAADALRRVHRRSRGDAGYVSVQVNAPLADAAALVAETTRLWQSLDRANVLISVPATSAGVQALRQLVAAGINVDASQLFGVSRYREVLDAFASGLEDRKRGGQPLDHVVSVASLAISRIDRHVDSKLAKLREVDRPSRISELLSRVGTEVARFLYQDFKKFRSSARWGALASSGARPQRLLWRSAALQDPPFGDDVRRIDGVVGRDTITALSAAALVAYRSEGMPAPHLEQDLLEVAALPADLRGLGIDLEQVSQQLETEGLARLELSARALQADVSALRAP